MVTVTLMSFVAISFLLLENKVTDLARKIESQIANKATKKPVGGVSILPKTNDEVQEFLVRLTVKTNIG